MLSVLRPGRGVGRHRERELERAGGRADQPRDGPRHDLAQDQLCQVAGKIFHKNISFKLLLKVFVNVLSYMKIF